MATDLATVLSEAERVQGEVVALRRRLHAEPELGLQLPETRRTVLEALAGLGLEIAGEGQTSSIVATLRGGRPGPTVLLRADMDALPLDEDTGLDFASKHAGRMHACGHDAHTAMLVGAARLLAERREALTGTVKFLFQAGEEGYGGARILVRDEGLLDEPPPPDVAFAVHITPSLPGGCLAIRPGPMLAAMDTFAVELTGRGGHGSMPHQAVDPIPVACEIVGAFQSLVTRRMDAFDPVILSVTRIEAGTTHNVIPASARLLGTTRSVSLTAREALHQGMHRVVAGVAAAHEVQGALNIDEGYPVTVNDAGIVSRVRDLARGVLGEDSLIDLPNPIMGAEDFSYILQRVPGAMAFLGAWPEGVKAPAPIHSNRMVLDEHAFSRGVALHTAVALDVLGRGG